MSVKINVEEYLFLKNTNEMHVFVLLVTFHYFDNCQEAIFGSLSAYNQSLLRHHCGGKDECGYFCGMVSSLILGWERDNTGKEILIF